MSLAPEDNFKKPHFAKDPTHENSHKQVLSTKILFDLA
jgi:hypothetical protein